MAALTAAGLIIGAFAVLILGLDARRLGRLSPTFDNPDFF